MTLTIAAVGSPAYKIVGAQRKTVTSITFDSSYPTGGEVVTAAQLGLNIVEEATAAIKTVGGTVNVTSVFCNIDSTGSNVNLVAYDETPAEVTDTATLATLVVYVTALGR